MALMLFFIAIQFIRVKDGNQEMVVACFVMLLLAIYAMIFDIILLTILARLIP
jgi:hypothetical protein